jgi:hypothetical protein
MAGGGPTVSATTGGGADATPERQLLEEGAESYVAAVSAILTFRREVQARCRRVVDKRLREYGGALGARVDRSQFADAEWPKAGAWAGDWASVGLEIKKVGKAGVSLYHNLDWQLGTDGKWTVAANASIWLPFQERVAELRDAFRPHPPELTFWEYGDEMGFTRPVPRTEMATFEVRLDEVFGEWIKLWQRVGGLKVLARV